MASPDWPTIADILMIQFQKNATIWCLYPIHKILEEAYRQYNILWKVSSIKNIVSLLNSRILTFQKNLILFASMKAL